MINDDPDRLFKSFKKSGYLTASSDAILLQENISAARSPFAGLPSTGDATPDGAQATITSTGTTFSFIGPPTSPIARPRPATGTASGPRTDARSAQPGRQTTPGTWVW